LRIADCGLQIEKPRSNIAGSQFPSAGLKIPVSQFQIADFKYFGNPQSAI
jgi:hypothetical protein